MNYVLLHNPSDVTQYGWFFCAFPKDVLKSFSPGGGFLTDGTTKYPVVVEEGGIRIWASLPAQRKVKLEFDTLSERKPEEFQWHHSLEGMKCFDVLPKFYIEGQQPSTTKLEQVSASEASTVWHQRCWWEHQQVTVDAWFTAYSGVDYVDFSVQCVYGSTANTQQPQTRSLGALYMTSANNIYADFARRNGHAEQTTMEDGRRSITVVPPQRWHRAVRYPMRGALCSPDTLSPSRSQGVQVYGLWTGWDESWGPIGKVPVATPGLESMRGLQLMDYLADTNHVSTGKLDAERPRVQERNSGTTGEQKDFGVASDLAVTANNSWEIHDALWQCQGYELRPTANKEPGGAPMSASKHPNAQTYNQRPDLSYGVGDRLGWPGVNQIEWMPSPNTTQWTTSDDQHRSDLFLHATYLLTRDPALKAVIEDHVQLDGTDVILKAKLRSSPRAIGRTALTRAWQYWLGFERALDHLCSGLDTAYEQSTMASLPMGKHVLILAGNEQAKYGWNAADGRPVIGWQPWQETIAAIGFYAASHVVRGCGVPWAEEKFATYYNIAETLANVATENAWRIRQDAIYHAYAIRWNNGDQFPDASWPAVSNNDASTGDIYVSSACSYWTAASAHIIDWTEMGAKFLKRFSAPRSLAEARWRAL